MILDRVNPGDEVKADAFNELIRRTERPILGGKRTGVKATPLGISVGQLPGRNLAVPEAATTILVVNDGEDPIVPYGACQVTGHPFGDLALEAHVQRALTVEPASSDFAGKIVVAAEAIAAGNAGAAFVSGVHPALVVGEGLELVGGTADGQYLVASDEGEYQVLWQSTPEDYDTPHLAIVRYTGKAASGISRARAATTASTTLSGEKTIDGVDLVEGDKCLVKNNSPVGIYEVSTGAWTLLSTPAHVIIEEGTNQAETMYWLTTSGAYKGLGAYPK